MQRCVVAATSTSDVHILTINVKKCVVFPETTDRTKNSRRINQER